MMGHTQQAPLDSLLDHLISISSQLIDSSTNALASTINSRECLSTLSKIENVLDRSIRIRQRDLTRKLNSIESHQLELDKIQDQLHSLWPQQQQQQHPPQHHHHQHLHYFINHHPQHPVEHQQQPSLKSSPSLKLKPLLIHPEPSSNHQPSPANAREHHNPTNQLLSPSVPSVRSDHSSILLDHHARQSFQHPSPLTVFPPSQPPPPTPHPHPWPHSSRPSGSPRRPPPSSPPPLLPRPPLRHRQLLLLLLLLLLLGLLHPDHQANPSPRPAFQHQPSSEPRRALMLLNPAHPSLPPHLHPTTSITNSNPPPQIIIILLDHRPIQSDPCPLSRDRGMCLPHRYMCHAFVIPSYFPSHSFYSRNRIVINFKSFVFSHYKDHHQCNACLV
ncbi:hypothetical protein PTTG_02212 [Puccinia triticina 1-1 BBBD Race 1]|uniref:Uncharacterized protein n=1 Tax=Puccinia triticina (isolate 1-1 / race 1 (BBBD)) TaxID=630390 RepID=A0A180GR22_PUCT1|nr:hypothetical protein PTTG_02212 [Puccinia triticina 1-1 BBBD Race 1]